MQESDADRRESRMQILYDVADYRYDGDLLAYPAELVDTIDRMEAALHNVIGERDQLLADLRHEIRKHGSCDFCQNVPFHAADCNGCTMDNDRWTWRGVPDKEE